jgi:hypothetical protein
MRKLIFASLLITTSCGIIQSHFGEPNYYDPEIQRKTLTELNSRKETKETDSLIHVIESSPRKFPEDMTTKTLIVETYNYEGFLKLLKTKFYEPTDTKYYRKKFAKYDRKKESLLKNYKHKILYADRVQYENLDMEEFRYVLKTTTKLLTKDEEVVIYSNGLAAAWATTLIYYILDRKTNLVFGQTNDVADFNNF